MLQRGGQLVGEVELRRRLAEVRNLPEQGTVARRRALRVSEPRLEVSSSSSPLIACMSAFAVAVIIPRSDTIWNISKTLGLTGFADASY